MFERCVTLALIGEIVGMKRLIASFVLSIGLIALPLTSDAKSTSGSRTHYSGSKHTTSHGGHYAGGKGSSHKGGSYKNTSTGNRYGKHKP